MDTFTRPTVLPSGCDQDITSTMSAYLNLPFSPRDAPGDAVLDNDLSTYESVSLGRVTLDWPWYVTLTGYDLVPPSGKALPRSWNVTSSLVNDILSGVSSTVQLDTQMFPDSPSATTNVVLATSAQDQHARMDFHFYAHGYVAEIRVYGCVTPTQVPTQVPAPPLHPTCSQDIASLATVSVGGDDQDGQLLVDGDLTTAVPRLSGAVTFKWPSFMAITGYELSPSLDTTLPNIWFLIKSGEDGNVDDAFDHYQDFLFPPTYPRAFSLPYQPEQAFSELEFNFQSSGNVAEIKVYGCPKDVCGGTCHHKCQQCNTDTLQCDAAAHGEVCMFDRFTCQVGLCLPPGYTTDRPVTISGTNKTTVAPTAHPTATIAGTAALTTSATAAPTSQPTAATTVSATTAPTAQPTAASTVSTTTASASMVPTVTANDASQLSTCPDQSFVGWTALAAVACLCVW